jgi:hypothetical protein
MAAQQTKGRTHLLLEPEAFVGLFDLCDYVYAPTPIEIVIFH